MPRYQFEALQSAMMVGRPPAEIPPDALNTIAWMLRERITVPGPLADPLAQALIYITHGQLRDARALFLVMRKGGRYRTAFDRSWRVPRDALIAAAVGSAPGTSLEAQAQHVLATVNSPDLLPGTTREEKELRHAFGGRPEMQLSTSQMVRIARGRSGCAPPDRRAKRHR